MKSYFYITILLLTSCSNVSEPSVDALKTTDSSIVASLVGPGDFYTNDSIFIAHTLKRLDAELRIGYLLEPEDSMHDILLNKLLNDEENMEDDYPHQTVAIWHTGNVHYAPDSAFKIFVFEGKDAGVTAQPMYYSSIVFKSGKKSHYSFDAFTSIQSIIKMNDAYALIQSRWYGGNAGGSEYSLLLLSLVEDSAQIIPLSASIDKPLNRYLKEGIFQVSSASGLEDIIFIKTDSINNRFQFQYGISEYQMETYQQELLKHTPQNLLPIKQKESIIITGEFELKRRNIVNFKEAYRKQLIDH